MRRIIFLNIVALLIATTDTKAQNLTVSELIKIRALNIEDVNDLLISKGWKYLKTEDGESSWAFNKTNDKATSWLQKYSANYLTPKITYQSSNLVLLKQMKAEMLNLGFKKKYNYTENKNIVSLYESKNYSIEITFSSIFDSSINEDVNYYRLELSKKITFTKAEQLRKLKQSRLDSLENVKNDSIANIESIKFLEGFTKAEQLRSLKQSRLDSLENVKNDSIANIESIKFLEGIEKKQKDE
jgi:hypothetical protein